MGIFRREDSPPHGISQRTTPEGIIILDPVSRTLLTSAAGNMPTPSTPQAATLFVGVNSSSLVVT